MIRKAYVDTCDGQIHYRYTTRGTGIPVAFFHMNPSTSQSYETLMAELDGTVPTFAFDTPNCGESFRKAHQEPSMRYIGEILLEALAGLGIAKVHGFGHHTGAHIALELAHAAPETVLSATLNGLVPTTPEEGADYIRTLAFTNSITGRGNQLMSAWTRTLTLEDETRVAFPPHIKNRECIAMLHAGEDWNWGYRAVFTDNASAKLDTVSQPIFFLIGAHDGAKPNHDREVLRHPEHPSFVHPDHGVFYAENAPADVAARLLEFIARVERRSGRDPTEPHSPSANHSSYCNNN